MCLCVKGGCRITPNFGLFKIISAYFALFKGFSAYLWVFEPYILLFSLYMLV